MQAPGNFNLACWKYIGYRTRNNTTFLRRK